MSDAFADVEEALVCVVTTVGTFEVELLFDNVSEVELESMMVELLPSAVIVVIWDASSEVTDESVMLWFVPEVA